MCGYSYPRFRLAFSDYCPHAGVYCSAHGDGSRLLSITLSPEATRSTLPHSVELCRDGSIKIVYADSDDNSNKSSVAGEAISPEEIISFRFSDEYLVYRLAPGRLLIIPLKDIDLPFDRRCQLIDFVEFCY